MQSEDAGSAAKPQRIRIGKAIDGGATMAAGRRVKDVEVSIPVVHGTIAFYLGRKASESQSHKWTVYVRGATNEDLGVVIKRAVFQLHPSFNNPTRVVESPPFELSESGWGEFEIAITLFFHSDVCDKQLDLSVVTTLLPCLNRGGRYLHVKFNFHRYHHLKLYPEDETGPQSTKKPVVMEYYNEVVFPDPSENFLARVQNHPAVLVPRLSAGFNLPTAPLKDINEREGGDTKDHPLSQWFMNFSEADELLKLAAARQQVQVHVVNLRRQLSLIDGLAQPSKPAFSDDL